jgi:hypothetical protein
VLPVTVFPLQQENLEPLLVGRYVYLKLTIIGASMMAPVLDAYGVPTVLYICGIVAFSGRKFLKILIYCNLGAIVTFFFIKETRGLSLEEVTNTAVAPSSPVVGYSTMPDNDRPTVPLEDN